MLSAPFIIYGAVAVVIFIFPFWVSTFFVVLLDSVATLASVKSFVGVAVENLSTSAVPSLTIDFAFNIELLFAALT